MSSSKTTKKRYVTKQLELEMVLPGKDEMVAQLIATRGNNLHEVEDANGERYLASMPSKFRNTVWVRRGQFILVIPIEEGDKVKAEIAQILDTENVLYIREKGHWPTRFEAQAQLMTRSSKRGADSDLFPPSDDSEDENEEEEEEGEGEGDAK